MVDITKIVRPNILTLEPYRCARDDYKEGILLDANENTHGPALTELSLDEKNLELHRYPDPHQPELKQNIVDFRNAKPNVNLTGEKLKISNLCLGVGSDESIDMLLRCVCQPGKDKLLVCPPTYGMYGVCATMNDVELVKVPLTYPDFQADNGAIVKAVEADENIKLVYLTSPGNPTAKLLDVSKIIDLLERLVNKNLLVIVDEAYIDFTETDSKYSQSMSTLVNQYENLVVLQTLSKSFGLAGIRLGITYANDELSLYLNLMKYPYNISSLTSGVAIRATSSGLTSMQKTVGQINGERSRVVEELSKIEGIGKNIGGMDSNFILMEILDTDNKPSNEVAFKLYQQLASKEQVVVRFRGKELNCTGALRIAIGTKEENDVLIETFKTVLKSYRS